MQVSSSFQAELQAAPQTVHQHTPDVIETKFMVEFENEKVTWVCKAMFRLKGS